MIDLNAGRCATANRSQISAYEQSRHKNTLNRNLDQIVLVAVIRGQIGKVSYDLWHNSGTCKLRSLLVIG